MLSKKVILKFYNSYRPLYDDFVSRLENKLKNELATLGLSTIPTVTSRVKKIDAFVLKAQAKRYSNLAEQFTDFAGLRVVVNDLEEVDKICKYIRESYVIDEKNSVDKKSLLAPDQFGYLSVHFIVSFNADSLKVVENKRFDKLKAEIQVRTRLQHAWAELVHDKVYKDKKNIDEYLQRQVNLMAGLLELADKEFVRINEEIERRKQESEPITVTSLNLFMRDKFKESIFLDAEQCVKELKECKIETTEDLNKILSDELYKELCASTEIRTYDGIVRNILIIHNAEAYFSIKNCNKRIGVYSKALYEKFGVPLEVLREKHGLKIHEK